MDEMENKDLPQEEPEEFQQEETPKYIPRPMWQVWGARVALVLFIIVILLYYLKIAQGAL